MKKLYKKRILIVLFTLSALVSVAFIMAGREERDFSLTRNLDIYISLFRELNAFYVDEIDPEKLVNKSINSMLATLDPYTVFYPEEEAGDLDFMTTGKYGGFGSQIRKSGDYIMVTNVYKGFPADKSGVRPGDLLITIDGKSLKGVSSEKASEMLKGDPGTEVEVTIRRNGEDITRMIRREKISISAVPYYGMVDEKTGYIRFTNFTQNCISEVKEALTDLKEKQGAEKLILDLRSNPGGVVSEAVEIVNLFVKAGQEVVSTKGRASQYDAQFRTTRSPVAPDMPVVVLINRSSASASEIVAGALQDLDRGVIVGERSYGKGLVQVARPLSYKAKVKLTTARYYIPSGRCIQALDFSHPNEDGSVNNIPDSLIQTFSTRSGRPVRDGGGIIPDVTIESEMLNRFASELYVQNMIFDYATRYYWSHPLPESLNSVTITDGDLEEFTQFLKERKFTYTNDSGGMLEQLITASRQEGLYDKNREAFEQLRPGLQHSLEEEIGLYRSEVIELIEAELSGRYFYDWGMIRYTIERDKQVEKAIEIASDRERYYALLRPATTE